MIITTTETIPGRNYQVLGLVKGSTIQSKNVFSDFGQSLKNVVGGELKSYTQMMDDSRRIATERMVKEAESLGADAIVCARFTTSSIVQQAAEVLAYGTAVKLL